MHFPSPIAARAAVTIAVTAGLFCIAAAAAEGPLAHRADLDAETRARVAAVIRPTDDFSKPEPFEIMQAGAATTRKRINRDIFSQSLGNLSFEQERDFKLGNGLFRKLWVSAPSSTQASDGLGPLFNARSCQRCHLKDGRGAPPAPGETASSMFLRLSVPPRTEEERRLLADKRLLRIPEPTYGGQLQEFAVPGLEPEGHMEIDYTEIPVTLAGGETVSLRKPSYRVTGLANGPMAEDAMVSPRVAPPMIGLGLIEQIHAGDILAHADPEDADGDGISGRPSMVRDSATGEIVLGRFGWKASQPDIAAQSSGAFNGDIGISSPQAPASWGDCTEAQAQCRAMPSGVQARLGDVEAPDPIMELVTFYARNLAVPRRRHVKDPQVLEGKRQFYAAGCASCHVPKYVTRKDAPQKEQAFQLIWPYSDLLLHDMGEGLADGRPVGDASGSEWRTSPLWGIGLTETVSGHTQFLHDGRARNLLEAILWHGGEAQSARDTVAAMSRGERAALIRFLESL
ncbi:di-heme oxidoredictase family protein [Breoghania sp. L-A4]|uniref:di-heme oxidoreductase family protein n=1 Tax=Breoghania sp. L-A4 TaxID=2304600 RepID=UPI000E3595D9|nr:di-heme oxidoredictase family protein [Breoghania sp. L-A4]AXS42123.1 thiol oxidoreductase [Breoghania sp. L-A4]